MDPEGDRKVLEKEAEIRGCPELTEASLAALPSILSGSVSSRVEKILHIFPHTGFTAGHLEAALDRYPGTDTILASICRLPEASDIVSMAGVLGLNVITGNSHALEIFENGLPLARALQNELPGLSITMFRERMTAAPLNQFGNNRIRSYGHKMASHMIDLH